MATLVINIDTVQELTIALDQGFHEFVGSSSRYKMLNGAEVILAFEAALYNAKHTMKAVHSKQQSASKPSTH